MPNPNPAPPATQVLARFRKNWSGPQHFRVSRLPARRSGPGSPAITRASPACRAGCGAPCNAGGAARSPGSPFSAP